MKKKTLGLILSAFTSIIYLASCGDNGTVSDGKINFHTGYESFKIDSVEVSNNGKITKPSVNDADIKVLGFYSDESFTNQIDFDKPIGNVKDIYVKALKGQGTSDSPYIIESGLSLSSLTHFGESTLAYAKLIKDIVVLSKYNEDYTKTEFNGTFDGQNHTITLENEGNNTGLFYKVGTSGSITNLVVVGNIVGEYASTGAVVNYNYGNINNVTTIGTEYHASNGCSNGVSLMTSYDEDGLEVVNDLGTLGELSTLSKGGAGAISGTNYGTIENCHNKMRVSATIGGGSMAGINYGLIKSCFNQGAIGASGNNAVNSTTIRDHNFSFSYIGGISGANYGEIYQCANLNQVFVARLPWLYNENPAGQDDFCGRIRVGGIAGYNYSQYDAKTNTFNGGKITECINYGRVHGDMQVGGIAGYSNGYISDCFFSGLIGGRNSVGSIVGWQPGDRAGDYPGLVSNCASFSRVVTGSESTVYDENDNSFLTTKLTNKASGTDSNISDYYKTAKYASNCVYHNNSGNLNPIDYAALLAEAEETNTSISSTATMAEKVYDKIGYKDGVETNLWTYESTSLSTAMVGIATSWQVYLNTRLSWQNKTITVKMETGDIIINGIAGIDYINTILTEKSDSYVSDWNANLSGVIPGRGLPEISVSGNETLIWVLKENDASTKWDGLLKDNITIYPMVV